MSRDCEHCKWKDTIREYTEDGEDYQECDAPKGHDCSAHYQTRIVISVQGDLRDRTKEQTEEEFEAFKDFINNSLHMYIRDYTVNIEGDY